MQVNKPEQRRKRHLASHQVTLRNHEYVLYQNCPELKCIPARGPVIIAGEAASGKTTAMVEMALDLVRDTVPPLKGKRHLLWIRTLDGDSDSMWKLLYSMLLHSMPGKEITASRVSENAMKEWMNGWDFDVMVGSGERARLDTSKYEVVHIVQDCDVLSPMPSVDNTGVRVYSVHKRRGGNTSSYACSTHLSFRADVIIETSISGGDILPHQIVGTVMKARRSQSGHRFTIAFLPRHTDGVSI